LIARDPTQWISYVGTQATGGAQRLDLLVHELQSKYHVDKLRGPVKTAAVAAVEGIRAFLLVTSASPNPTAYPADGLVVFGRSLWYGSLVHTHGVKTADAWLARATDAPQTFVQYAQAFDGLPANLKAPRPFGGGDDRRDGERGGGQAFRTRGRGGKRWKNFLRRFGDKQQKGDPNGKQKSESAQSGKG
jgi:hypothetical protein